MRSALPHRHTFFVDSDTAEAVAEWQCACGIVAFHDGADPESGLVVLTAPAPAELAALEPIDDALLARALEGLHAVPESAARTA